MRSVGMFTRVQPHERTVEHLRSAILNCICPACGGALSITTRQFRCQGKCREDWRPIWDRLCSAEAAEPRIHNKSVSRSVRAA